MADPTAQPMSQKDLIKCLEKKQAILERLNAMTKRVTNLPFSSLSEDFRGRIGIEITYLDLRDHLSTSDKVYFKPYPAHDFPTIPWNEVKLYDFDPGRRAQTFRVQNNLNNVLASFTPPWPIWIEHKFYSEDGNSRTEVGECLEALYHWYTVNEAETHPETTTPHCTVRIMQFTDPEEDLLMRSEVICALKYMMCRLKFVRYEDQTIFPMLITSIFPSKVRILQVYFDGESLRFAKSQLYDLTENDYEKYALLARWMFPVPDGDVNTVHIRGRKLSVDVQQQVDVWKQRQDVMNMDDWPERDA
ncbi:hypothetical protein ASPBRDRAFT_57942 [Aspergillus brasiliensis CBS 101740]|uniref:Uncharacterized protein n=1 Tax=Aspergillus brasiliensis (strain CBS 101740 / IMI 381727 / IBT 21946) TaxID=767769 RepID=A0A1L9UA76_ASPBC|nr:hypothetical protein ASPBRDRAFT_57942 [Aspergillus brasiliensis CBS 101740]